jgi:hypothetical protein
MDKRTCGQEDALRIGRHCDKNRKPAFITELWFVLDKGCFFGQVEWARAVVSI